MHVNRLETHDRYEYFLADQNETIAQGAEECLKSNPDSLFFQNHSPYIYIFAHSRTDDSGYMQTIERKRLIWQPRLTRPTPESNSYLFRADSNTDILEICWILPPHEYWSQYKEGNVVESDVISWSIDQYRNHFSTLAQPHKQDMTLEQSKKIWHLLIDEKRRARNYKKLQNVLSQASDFGGFPPIL